MCMVYYGEVLTIVFDLVVACSDEVREALVGVPSEVAVGLALK